jgi:2-hydroxychromene-2-carboxylate isomerase
MSPSSACGLSRSLALTTQGISKHYRLLAPDHIGYERRKNIAEKDNSMKEAYWYFDFISPFAYLQSARFSELSQTVRITPVPVVFGALLQHWGQLGPAEIPPKRKFIYRFFQWQADRLNVPFVMPPSHPFNPLPPLRLCIAAGGEQRHIEAIFDAIYGRGLQPDDPAAIATMAKELLVPEPETALAQPDIKAKLRANTESAIGRGVFGVPTFVVDNEVFWGSDATDMMLNYVRNPEVFETTEMKRISHMPMGVVRR